MRLSKNLSLRNPEWAEIRNYWCLLSQSSQPDCLTLFNGFPEETTQHFGVVDLGLVQPFLLNVHLSDEAILVWIEEKKKSMSISDANIKKIASLPVWKAYSESMLTGVTRTHPTLLQCSSRFSAHN